MKSKNLLLASACLTIFSISIIIFQFSCSQQAPAQISGTNCFIPQPKLQFKGNQILYTCDAITDSRFGWIGYPFIIINSTGVCSFEFINVKPPNFGYSGSPIWWVNFPSTPNKIEGSLSFNILGSSLNIGNYSTNDIVFSFNENLYHYESVPNSISISITSISNGLASGTFSGIIPAVNNTVSHGPQMNITEGLFNNIPIFE